MKLDIYQPDKKLRKLFNKKVKQRKIHVLYEGKNGGIPILSASGKGLAEAWENSLIALYVKGCWLRTEYDRKDNEGNFIDPPSKDCTMHMVVEEPLSEPYIHRAFPGGLEDLEEYRQEVLDGIKDHWVRDKNNPDDKKWEYTYHERIVKYSVPGLEEKINQLELMAEKIAKSPITRRAQIVSWKPWEDNSCYDPACFQSLWGRAPRFNDTKDDVQVYRDNEGTICLNLNIRFRSRDAYDAAFMNDFAFILLGEKLANRISEIKGEEVRLGRFEDSSDSYHIYGRRIENFKEGFIEQLFSRKFEDRTWTMEFAEPFFEEARPLIKKKIEKKDKRDKES